MTSHSNLVDEIAKRVCRICHCSGLLDDLRQIGEMTANRLSYKSNSYIAKAVRHAMLKSVPKRQPESLRDCDFPTTSGIELSAEFYVDELTDSAVERSIFLDHYIRNIPVKEIAKTHRISMSAIYRTLSRLKKDFANVI